MELEWLSADAARADVLRVPAARGVAVFEAAGGRGVLIAASGDLRALVRRRLVDPPARGGADLRGVVERVGYVRCDSMVEAELVFLALASERAPETYTASVERSAGWFVRVDPRAAFPRFEKASTTLLAREPPAAGESLIGPFRDKHAAGRAIELIEDLFDLCRYHHILVQSPDASACVYKELGKCPAPCDGSETLHSYRARVREAVAFGGDVGAWRARVADEMRAASSAMEFERAGRLKAQVDAAGVVDTPPMRHAGRGWESGWVALAPGAKAGWVSVLVLGRSPAVVGGAVSVACDDPGGEVSRVCEGLWPSGRPVDRLGWHGLGLVCDWLYRPESGRSPVWVVGRGSVDRWDEAARGAWASAVAACQRGANGASEEGEGLSMEGGVEMEGGR